MMDHKKCTKCPLKLTRAQLHIFVQTDFFTGKYPMKTVYSRRCGNEKKMGVNCVFLILWFIVDNNWMQHSQKFRVLFCLSWKIWHRQWSTRRHGELKENWCCWLRMGHSRLFFLRLSSPDTRPYPTCCFWPHYYLCQGGDFFSAAGLLCDGWIVSRIRQNLGSRFPRNFDGGWFSIHCRPLQIQEFLRWSSFFFFISFSVNKSWKQILSI